MEQIIRKILRESDFDWIKEVPSFIEIIAPISQTNPKNKFRLSWTNGHGEDSSVWADSWYTFNNDNQGVNDLTRYVKILQNGVDTRGNFSVYKLVELYLTGNHDYIADNEIEMELANINDDDDDKKDMLHDWLYEELHDMGILYRDSYSIDDATIEKFWVNYFDEVGIEYKTKINKV